MFSSNVERVLRSLREVSVAQDFYPFVDNANVPTDHDPSVVRHPARIAVYDDAAAAPRVVVVEPQDVRSYLEEITLQVTQLAQGQGGTIPFMVIREIVENFIHAFFLEPTISILDHGNTIRFSDQGPGIREKARALQYGTTSATEAMRRYIRGVGSGLPYAHQYMVDKGGSLEISDNIAGGTVVTISTRARGNTHDAQSAGQNPEASHAAEAYQQPWGYPMQGPYGAPNSGYGAQAPAYAAGPQGYVPAPAAWPQHWQQYPPAPPAGYAPIAGPQGQAVPPSVASPYMAQDLVGWGAQAQVQLGAAAQVVPQAPAIEVALAGPSPLGTGQGATEAGTQAGGLGPSESAAAAPKEAGGLSWVQVNVRGRAVLDYLVSHDSVGPSDLARTYGESQPTWTRELQTLEEQGLVRKDGQKRRLTAMGRAFVGS